ncbi:uncharacterized protein DDB_G0292186-like [Clytia hemisphaerica]|uniref:uncharacterized protein DDB_G0292186-like n=1 Tax=Clytia hemisphaerica TaxID=252671 RepID=UPI0034D406E3
MENTTGRTSSRGRKRYNCCYCNVYFHQTDSWQRHNRKHTGVEIECDDCGQMCSDFFELKSHQRLCEAYRVYSEEHFTEISDNNKESKKEQDTPDSTSNKQEHSVEQGNRNLSPWPESRDDVENSPSVSTNDEVTKGNTSELDDLIGEDTNNSIENTPNTQEDNEDPETEAMIGVDESVSHLKTDLSPDNNNNKNAAAASERSVESNNIGMDNQIVIKVESALNDAKRGIQQQKLPPLEREDRPAEMHSFLPRPPPLTDVVQPVPMDNAEMNKKYQPYFWYM